MKKIGYPLLLIGCAGLFACSSPQKTAPISDRSSITTSNPYQPIDKNTIRYTVKRGDTLSQISRRSGHSVHDLAAWNNLSNMNALEVGQVLRVQPPEGAASTQTVAVASTSQVQVRSIDEAKKDSRQKTTTQSSTAAPVAASGSTKEVSGLVWSWPTQGTVITSYIPGKNRGIDIAGTKGQKVVAAADGTVLHRGSMNGYGNLVIIKHSDGMLSAYAHNDKILVKEKQQVKRGQQIAEMGNTDSDKVKLHFEIRYQGKPVDPLKYLPAH